MNITKAFADYMEGLGYGIFGTDLFIGGVPLEAPSTCWWIISGGGNSISKNATLGRQNSFVISIFYRDTDTEQVYELLQEFCDEINTSGCISVGEYEVVDIDATVFPTDDDLDSEERTVGTMQIALTVYQS